MDWCTGIRWQVMKRQAPDGLWRLSSIEKSMARQFSCTCALTCVTRLCLGLTRTRFCNRETVADVKVQLDNISAGPLSACKWVANAVT